MTIGEIVRLRIMPEEAWEVIDQRQDQFCLQSCEEPRMAIWAREGEILKPDNFHPQIWECLTVDEFFKRESEKS